MDSNIESSGDERIPHNRFCLINVSENFGYVRDVATAVQVIWHTLHKQPSDTNKTI